MASPRAILAATKAVPGTAQPTPPPQGGGQWYGQVSPLARDQDTSNGYASAYGPFLPRPASEFTAGAFGPFSPILPVPVDTPEDDGRAVPRRGQYEVGWNLPTGQPGTEGIKLATFQTLRSIADLYSVARSCIQLRKNEIKGIGWDIVPTPDASKAMRGDKKAMRDFGERRGKAMRFFHRPDPDYFTWSSWIGDVMEQMLVFDALSIFLQPKRGRGMGKGLLGSDLDSFSLIDGETIRPLYDLNGATPRPPAPGYQQYLYGVPRTDLTSVITGRDIEQSGVAESAWKKFRGDQLLYLPVEKRRWTPYGFPPVERALLPIMAGLQKQGYALDFFREGTVPAVYISPGDASMTPNQIRELQDALNAIAGDPAFHHKIIVLPPGSRTEPQRPAALADQFDEVVMNWVCMSFDVSPMELGIAPKVSTTMSPGASNQMAKMSQGSQERKATKPTLEYLGAICDFVLQEVCHQDDMRFLFEGLEEEEDEQTKTATLVSQIGAGLLSIDEGRGEIGKQPWGLPETSDPGWASATGFLPLGQMNTQGQPLAGFAQPDAAHPAGQPPTPGQPGQAQQGQVAAPAPRRAVTAQGQRAVAQGNQGQSPGHDAAEAAHGSGSGRGGGQPAASGKAAGLELAVYGDGPADLDVVKHDAWMHEPRDHHGRWTRGEGMVTDAVGLGEEHREGHHYHGQPHHGAAQHHPAGAPTVAEEEHHPADLGAVAAANQQARVYTEDQVAALQRQLDELRYEMHAEAHKEAKAAVAIRIGAIAASVGMAFFTGGLSLVALGPILLDRLPDLGKELAEFYHAHRVHAPHLREQPTLAVGKAYHPDAVAVITRAVAAGLAAGGLDLDTARTLATGIVSAAAGQVAAGKFPADPDFMPDTLVQGLLGHPQPHPASKAALAELDALARHLRKGRAAGTWQARHLPEDLVREIAADIADGWSPADAVKTARSALAKVGPHGYIHGWIFVGIPGVGDHVFHPHHGHGQVTESEAAGEHGHPHVTVSFDDGHAASFPVRHDQGPGHFEKMTEDELATELASGEGARFQHAVQELDRRDRAERAGRVAGLYAQTPTTEEDRNRVYQGLVDEGENPEDAWAHAYGTDTETMTRKAAIQQLRAQGFKGRNFEELARDAFKTDVQRRVLDAEAATNGVLLNRDGQKAGVDPWSLFTGPETRARKYASSELGEWWDQNGRPTSADFQAMLLGQAAGAGPRGGDFYA